MIRTVCRISSFTRPRRAYGLRGFAAGLVLAPGRVDSVRETYKVLPNNPSAFLRFRIVEDSWQGLNHKRAGHTREIVTIAGGRKAERGKDRTNVRRLTDAQF